jgi:hypothetical protein
MRGTRRFCIAALAYPVTIFSSQRSGSARFRKISAVEGIKYSPGMKGQNAVARLKSQTPEEKRKAIIQAYRKKA